jgi:dihydroorotase-like cyclic amidohydrolase
MHGVRRGRWSMTEQDMTEQVVGPIDYLALELPAAKMKGEGLAALVDLVDRGIIRILDLRVVKREADGTFTAMAITDLDNDGTLDLAIFEGIESGLLDDDDLRQAAELIEPGKVVALLLYENTWAAPFVAAMRRAGAELIASGRIPADEVEAILDALEADEAQTQAT